MNVRELTINGWTCSVTDSAVALSTRQQEQARNLVAMWAKVAPQEANLASRQHGVPSLIIRLDATVMPNDKLAFYEVEERPAGIGSIRYFSPDFREAVDVWKTQVVPNLHTVISPLREKGCDDTEWIPSLTMSEAEASNYPLIVRAEPEENAFFPLQTQSISSLTLKGDKGYGEMLGMWKRFQPGASLEELPWEDGFVVKRNGSKARAVWIWSPNRKFGGAATRTKITQVLGEGPYSYIQPLYLPERVEIGGVEHFRMVRIYAGYFPEHRGFRLLGGAWCSRPNNLKLHGASDTLFGPLYLE